MLGNLLNYQIYGNSFLEYMLFIGILLLSAVFAKFIYWLFSKIFLSYASKTKTNLDDLLILALRGPIVLAVLLFGMFIGVKLLFLNDSVKLIYNKILFIGVVIIISWSINKMINAFLKHYILPFTKKSKSKFDDTLFPVLKNLVNFSVLAITVIIILQNLGVQVTGLVAGLGIGGLAFALAAQDLLSNMFGGAAIVTDKPFQIGDRVKVDGKDGFVSKITLRSTTLKTFGGTTIVMPNKRIADSTLENVSSELMRRISLVLGLTYDTSSTKLAQAKKLLSKIIKSHKCVADSFSITFNNFGASSLDIKVIYYIKDLNNILSIKDDINTEIKMEFDKAKIDFAFPTQTIYLKK